MGVPDQPGNARRAAWTARSTSWWPDIGTREMTEPSLGLWTSIVGSVADSFFRAPAMTLGTVAYFIQGSGLAEGYLYSSLPSGANHPNWVAFTTAATRPRSLRNGPERYIATTCHEAVTLAERRGVTMTDDMGIFRTDVEIENHGRPGEKRLLRGVLMDTGAEFSWVPASTPAARGARGHRRGVLVGARERP